MKQKFAIILAVISLMVTNVITVYAYTPIDTSTYGTWEQDTNGNWKYGNRIYKDGKEEISYVTGIQIIENTVYEFDDNGVYINRNQKYYKDKFNELYDELNKMSDVIMMPDIAIADSQAFWATFNNRICGSSAGIQFITGDKLNCTNLDELKFAMDKYMEFVSQSTSYINSLWNKNATRDKKGNIRQLKDAKIDEILSIIQKDIHESCIITKEGSRPAYVFTGSSSINSRDVSVAIADALCRIGIPAVTCSSIETGQLYVCYYSTESNTWKWCDFTKNGVGTYLMNYVPSDLVYYY